LKVDRLAIDGLAVIVPNIFEDERGYFSESWSRRAYADAGFDIDFVQDNHSLSAQGVLRGLHYQLNTPQGKLVRVTRGSVFDVAVDLRRSSPSFGQYQSLVLSAENRKQFWVPAGFAHGFLSLEDGTEVQYKCDAPYTPGDEYSLLWSDSQLGIDWPLAGGAPSLSPKDTVGSTLADAATFE